MTKIYLAAYYGWQERMRLVRGALADAGHEVTSRWIDQDMTRATPDDIRNDPAKYAAVAAIDMEDINAADMLVCFNSLMYPSVGRHVEFGLAYAWGIQCVVVGARETPFHTLHDVQWFPSASEFLQHMGGRLP